MTEALSSTVFVIDGKLPWPGPAGSYEAGGSFDPALLYDGRRRCPCTVSRISALGVTVRGAGPASGGQEVSIELANSLRPRARVEWTSDDEAGIRFERPVDVLALVNRNLVNQPAERRAMPRLEVSRPAYIKWGGNLVPATLRNISARGLQIEGQILPARRTFVSTFIDDLVVFPRRGGVEQGQSRGYRTARSVELELDHTLGPGTGPQGQCIRNALVPRAGRLGRGRQRCYRGHAPCSPGLAAHERRKSSRPLGSPQ